MSAVKVKPDCQMGTPIRGYGSCSGRIAFCEGHIAVYLAPERRCSACGGRGWVKAS